MRPTPDRPKAFRSIACGSGPTAAIAPTWPRRERSQPSCRRGGRSSSDCTRRSPAWNRASKPRPSITFRASSPTSTAGRYSRPASRILDDCHAGLLDKDGVLASVIISEESLHALTLTIFGDPQHDEAIVEQDDDHRREL